MSLDFYILWICKLVVSSVLSPSFYILQRYDTWRTACDKSADEPLRNIDEQIMSENHFSHLLWNFQLGYLHMFWQNVSQFDILPTLKLTLSWNVLCVLRMKRRALRKRVLSTFEQSLVLEFSPRRNDLRRLFSRYPQSESKAYIVRLSYWFSNELGREIFPLLIKRYWMSFTK